MYAVVKSGGKQYKVEEGQVLRLEKISGDVGSSVRFDQVLMVGDGEDIQIGQPVLDGVSVQGRIIEQGRAKKIIVFKYKRRKRYRRKLGHRQQYTAVQINSIMAKTERASKKPEPEKEDKKPEPGKVEAKKAEPEKKETKKADAKKVAAKKADTTKTTAKKAETEKAAPKKAETKKTTAKESDTKKAESKKE